MKIFLHFAPILALVGWTIWRYVSLYLRFEDDGQDENERERQSLRRDGVLYNLYNVLLSVVTYVIVFSLDKKIHLIALLVITLSLIGLVLTVGQIPVNRNIKKHKNVLKALGR